MARGHTRMARGHTRATTMVTPKQIKCYEELEQLTHEERETWLAEQCTLFEQEVRNFFPEKEYFVEHFHKKLRKISRRWASWNHRSFGQVNSREQVRELSQWARNNQPKFGPLSTSEVEEIDPLDKFEDYCTKSNRLLQTFRQEIYRPLCDFFSGDDADSFIKEIKVLERCVQKWEALLQFSPVNERLFSKQSEKIVLQSTRTLIYESDSVVRLIPDLHEKKIEALRLARKWRLTVKSKGIQRRGTYTVSPKTLSKRENMPRCRAMAISHENFETNGKSYDEIVEDLRETQYKYIETKKELVDTKRKCDLYEKEIASYTNELDKIREECKHTDEVRKVLEHKVNESHSSSLYNPSECSEGGNRDKIWHRELESIKLKYSTHKIKYMNARKVIETLNKQLEISKQKYGQLENNAEKSSLRCSKLSEQLEIARKNIQTQGNMVDALQHQCYTLKHDLDQSNVKKGELYDQLGSTLERCKTVESDLIQTRRKYKDLEDETGRRKSREEQLERENTQLRHILESQSSRRRSREEILERENLQLKTMIKQKTHTPPSSATKKDCIFPDINAGRSL